MDDGANAWILVADRMKESMAMAATVLTVVLVADMVLFGRFYETATHYLTTSRELPLPRLRE